MKQLNEFSSVTILPFHPLHHQWKYFVGLVSTPSQNKLSICSLEKLQLLKVNKW